MAKKAANSDGGMGAFASAVAPILNPKLGRHLEMPVHQIYASAFEDAVSQINASLQPVGSVVASIRARATELGELADLIETTLSAKAGETTNDTEGKGEDCKDEGAKADKSAQAESRPQSDKGE